MSNKIKKFSVVIPLFGILTFVLIFILINCGKKPAIKSIYERGAYAVRFDGININDQGMQAVSYSVSFDYRNVPITVEAWIKADADKPKGGIVKAGQKEDGWFLFHGTSSSPLNLVSTARFGVISEGQVCSNVGDECMTWQVDSGVAVNDGQWHHVAGVLSGPQSHTAPVSCLNASSTVHLGIYVDGSLKACTAAGYITGVCSSGDMIGWDEASIREEDPSYSFKGVIDEVRIWQEARTESQILAGMNTEITFRNRNQLNPNNTLRSYWTFNEGGGSTVHDKSGNSPPNNGELEYCTSACRG